MNNREELLHDIDIVSFVTVELALYLDTHPYDRNAIDYYKHYNNIKLQMENDFSNRFYPLSLDLTECNKDWRWGLAPLPWEGECEHVEL